MGKLRQTALILGEGPTEFFYFKSLCDVFKRLTIKPDFLSVHSSQVFHTGSSTWKGHVLMFTNFFERIHS